MGSADLPEPAATRQQNLYTCRSSAPYLSSVMLCCAQRVSAKLRVASKFYSVPLSLNDEELRRQIVWHSKILSVSWLGRRNVAARRCANIPRSANSGKSADPIWQRDSSHFKICIAMRRAILKIKKGLAYLSLDLICDLKENLTNFFVRMHL
jgi:hypothetical protein